MSSASGPTGPGAVLTVSTGEVSSMNRVWEFEDRTVYDPTGGVYYVPFISIDGRVGYRIGRTDERAGEETFLYFNPSEEDSDRVPNVFVYLGPENDPTLDSVQHYYTLT